MYEGRQEGGLTPQKLEFARSIDEGHRFGKSPSFGVEAMGATAIIGAAAQRGSFSRPVLQAVTKVPTPERHTDKMIIRLSGAAWHGMTCTLGVVLTHPSNGC